MVSTVQSNEWSSQTDLENESMTLEIRDPQHTDGLESIDGAEDAEQRVLPPHHRTYVTPSSEWSSQQTLYARFPTDGAAQQRCSS